MIETKKGYIYFENPFNSKENTIGLILTVVLLIVGFILAIVL